MKKIILLLMSLLFISCSQKEGCMDTYACNYDEIAEIDDGSCIYSHEYYDCEFNCLLDTDFDGICDELEILGCTDLSACNYSENATENDGLCTYPEMNYDCDGNCLSDYDECGDCEHTYFPEIPSSINILSGGNCFKNQDLNVINKVISLNNLNYNSPLEVGTQTWSEGRLRVWVAGNYFNGISTPLDTLPENFGDLNDLRSLYLEWNNIKIMPESFENLTNLISLYFSNNGLTNIIDNIGNLTELYNLDLGYNQIKIIPDSFAELTNLQYVWLFNNQIETLPNGFCNLNINWSEMDAAWYPYFAIGGNQLCENIPECVVTSSHFEFSLDQFYYSFLVGMPQNCED